MDEGTEASPVPGRPLDVLLMTHSPNVWGLQRQLLDLAVPLAERGVRFTSGGPPTGAWRDAWSETGLPYVPTALPAHRGLRAADAEARPGISALLREAATVGRSAWRIARVARGYDVVFSVSLSGHVEAVVAGRLARKPVVLMLVDIVRPGLGRRLLQLASAGAWATVADSWATAETLDHRGRVEMIHHGIDTKRFHPGTPDLDVRASLGAGEGDLLVGIVGRVDEEKGIHHLVDAVHRLRRPDVKLVVVGARGTGPAAYEEELHRKGRELLGTSVLFAGRRQDIPSVLRALDVLVNASRAEPFGLSVLEAQASGLAVIGTDAGGIPEFVTHGSTGLLVPPGDVPALADALERLLGDPALRRRLGAAASASAERFDVSLQFDRWVRLFSEAAGRVTVPAS